MYVIEAEGMRKKVHVDQLRRNNYTENENTEFPMNYNIRNNSEREIGQEATPKKLQENNIEERQENPVSERPKRNKRLPGYLQDFIVC